MQKISAVQYDMTEGGTITVSKAEGPGWNVTFSYDDHEVEQRVASVPEWIDLVTEHCGWPAACRSID